MAFNPVTNLFYAAAAVASQVVVLDGTTNTVEKTISVPSDPTGIAINSTTNTIYVVADHVVTVIDGTKNTVSATITVGTQPYAVAVNTATNKIYVADTATTGTNNVYVIDGTTNTITSALQIGGTAYQVAVNSTTNTIYVANNTVVAVIDGVTDKVATTIARPPASQQDPVNLPQLAVNEATNTVFMANIGASPTVSVIDGVSNIITSTIPVGSGPCRMAENSLTNTVYVTNCLDNTVSVINGATDVVAATVPVSAKPTGIAVNPTANLIYVEGGLSLTMINGVTNTVIQ